MEWVIRIGQASSYLRRYPIGAFLPENRLLLLKVAIVEVKRIDMLLTRQQAKAQKRNAKRLGQLLKDARAELEQSLVVLEDSAIEDGSWVMKELSYSQNVYSVLGQILAIADKWEQCNHFEIDEKLSQLEQNFYQD